MTITTEEVFLNLYSHSLQQENIFYQGRPQSSFNFYNPKKKMMKNSYVPKLLLTIYAGFFSAQIFAANDELDGGGEQSRMLFSPIMFFGLH